MNSKTWVCAVCSQDFTRKYSAHRHSRDLHHGQGIIVRMIDYVIGRISGEYKPGNPLAYRSGYKQQDSVVARSDADAKASTFPFASVAHDSLKATYQSLPLIRKSMLQADNPILIRFSRQPLSRGISSKINEIEELSRTLLPLKPQRGYSRSYL